MTNFDWKKTTFFNISSQIGNLLSRQILKTKSINCLHIFAYKIIYFWNKLPNQIKNSTSVKNLKIKLDDFRKDYWINYLTEFGWSVDIVSSVQRFIISFFKVDVRI